MECKKRNLNPHETYACNVKDVKSLFGNEDNVFIDFGYFGRDFKFDSSEPERQVSGIIIASASITKRDNIYFDFVHKYFISFYVIKNLEYNAKDKKTFKEIYLPLMYQWYQEMLVRPETAPSGVEQILIEWSHDNFKVHRYWFH